MSATTLTKFTVNLLKAVQNIESVRWQITRRAVIGNIEIDSETSEEDFLGIADMIQLDAGLGFTEIRVNQRSGGRVVVTEAAFGKPILEFTPQAGRD